MDPIGSTPFSLQTMVFFLLPGFLFVQLFHYQIPDRNKPELSTVIWYVMASFILTSLTGWFFDLLSLLGGTQLLINSDQPIFHATRLIIMLLLSISLGKFVQSNIFLEFSRILFGVKQYPFGRIWNSFFDLPPNSVIKVFLSDKTCYVGLFIRNSNNPDDEIQEIELWKPYYFDKKNATVTQVAETQKVLIQANQIVSVELVKTKPAQKLYPPAKGEAE